MSNPNTTKSKELKQRENLKSPFQMRYWCERTTKLITVCCHHDLMEIVIQFSFQSVYLPVSPVTLNYTKTHQLTNELDAFFVLMYQQNIRLVGFCRQTQALIAIKYISHTNEVSLGTRHHPQDNYRKFYAWLLIIYIDWIKSYVSWSSKSLPGSMRIFQCLISLMPLFISKHITPTLSGINLLYLGTNLSPT